MRYSPLDDNMLCELGLHITDFQPAFLISFSTVIYFSGIFVICEEDVFEEPSLFSKLKLILNYVYKSLSANPHMYGNCPNTNDRLVLHMSTSTKVLKCKSVEVGTSKFAITPVEWKFLPKPQQWQRLDCYYEFDEVYPVVVKKSGISVKQQFQVPFCYSFNVNLKVSSLLDELIPPAYRFMTYIILRWLPTC